MKASMLKSRTGAAVGKVTIEDRSNEPARHHHDRRADYSWSWRWLCEIRRRQLDAWKAARPQQPALFDLKDDSRPAWEHNAAPSLLAWLQVYGSCSGSTQPHL